MNFYNVILYSTAGEEIAREDDVEGMRRARERAQYLISEDYARACETTHASLRTDKVAIFREGEPTGHNTVCEWDAFLPDRLRAPEPAVEEDGVNQSSLPTPPTPRATAVR